MLACANCCLHACLFDLFCVLSIYMCFFVACAEQMDNPAKYMRIGPGIRAPMRTRSYADIIKKHKEYKPVLVEPEHNQMRVEVGYCEFSQNAMPDIMNVILNLGDEPLVHPVYTPQWRCRCG